MSIHSNTAGIVNFVAAACSGGKTYAAVRLIAKKIKTNSQIGRTNFCLVGPTLLWIKQTEADFQSLGVHPVVITSETNPGDVVPRIVEFLKAKRHQNCVLLITHTAYFSLPYFHRRREDWNVIIDEVPQLDCPFDPRLPRSCRVLDDLLYIGEVYDDQVGELLPKDVAAIERFLGQPLDDCDEPIRPVLEAAINANKMLLVHVPGWERLVDVGCVSKSDDEKNRVHFLTMLKPEPFIGTAVMGADVKKSLLWHWLEKFGVEWREHRGITENLRYREYPESLGQRVVIRHFMDEGCWSKRMRNGNRQKGIDGLQSQFDAGVRKHVGDHPFLLCANRDYAGDLLRLPGCEQLPAYPHGLNSFQHHTRLVFSAALNRKPLHAAMLQTLGLRIDVQRASTVHSVLHQAVMRTALRNPSSTEIVEIVVPDRFSADALVEALGSATVSDLAGKYEPRRRRPAKTKENQQNPETEVNQNNSTSDHDIKCDKNVTTKIDADKDSITPHFSGDNFATDCPAAARPRAAPTVPMSLLTVTLHKRDADRRPYAFQEKTVSSVLGLVKLMRKFSQRVRTTKEGDHLFVLSKFGADAPRDRHLLSYRNHEECYGIVLDFDNGSVTPAEFERIFWHEAGPRTKHSFIITNSFNNSPDACKFRVIMPFIRPCCFVNHWAIYDSIVMRLEQEGHPPETSGLDKQSQTGVQSFFLPCTNAAHPDHAFFRTFGSDRTRDFEKYAIRPENYIRLAREEAKDVKRNTPRSTSEASTAHSGGRMTPEPIAKIEEMMAEIGAMRQGRREPVHKLVGQMLMAGMTMREVEEQLHAWADDAHLHDHVDSAIERWERIWQDQQCKSASDNAAASNKTDQEQPHARPQGRWKPRTVSREQIEQWKREPKPLGESTIELVRDETGETHSVMRPITEDDIERIERDHQRRQKACDRRRARKTNDLGIKMNWSL